MYLGCVYGADGQVGHQEQQVGQAQADQQLVEHREHNLTQVTYCIHNAQLGSEW